MNTEDRIGELEMEGYDLDSYNLGQVARIVGLIRSEVLAALDTVERETWGPRTDEEKISYVRSQIAELKSRYGRSE